MVIIRLFPVILLSMLLSANVSAAKRDTRPDPFRFVDQAAVALSTLIESGAVVITGINTAAPISVSGGQYSINGGSYTAVSGTVRLGQSVKVRRTSSSQFSTTVNVTLTVGGVSDTFSITTHAADTAPDAFSFTDQSNVALSTLIESSAVTITGINTAAPISIGGGEYSINGGAYTAVSGTIQAGQSVKVRRASSDQFSTTVNVTLVVGGVSDVFSLTTLAADTAPDAFSFTDQSNVALSALIESSAVTITGINTAAPISITGGEYSINGGVYTAEAGAVQEGQSIRVRRISSDQFSTTVDATLTVGGVSDVFSVTTVAVDTVPDAFGFEDRSNVALSTLIESSAVGITGINAPAPVSVSGGEYAIDGGSYTSADGVVNEGQSITIRQTSSAYFSQTTDAVLTVGGIVAAFSVSTGIPDFIPDQVASDGQGTIFMLSKANRVVFRWSVDNSEYMDSLVTGANPSRMAYSEAHNRLYLGYPTGAIRYIGLAGDSEERPFANIPLAVNGLAEVGNYVLAQDETGAWESHHIFDAGGIRRDSEEWNYYSREYAWSPTDSRVYFFRDNTSPNDLHYEVINQGTGLITGVGETPYHGDYSIAPPIRVSVNGQYVLLGSGDLYSGTDLTWSGSLGASITDALWLADGSVVTLLDAGTATTLQRRDTSLNVIEELSYTGKALGIYGTEAGIVVLVINGGTVAFHGYIPNNDSDGDGVDNAMDAFPLDPAASVDSDNDGYPDAWNAGYDQSGSTTGLTLDAYPNDAECYLPAHGDGVNCDYGATLPNYVPDEIVSDGGIIYLFSRTNKRIYRWSLEGGKYLKPVTVGIARGHSTVAPLKMTYSPAHGRLYLGYDTGAIRYIDLAGALEEQAFANTPLAVNGLAAVGNYILAQDATGAWESHHIFDMDGILKDSEEWNYYSSVYAWSPAHSRVYFFRDGISPNDLHYEVIDQGTGLITGKGETPYHMDYSIVPPIRVSADGSKILIGSGNIFNASGMTWAASLGISFVDAVWTESFIITVQNALSVSQVKLWNKDSLSVVNTFQYPGIPLRLIQDGENLILVRLVSGVPAFTEIPVGN